MKDFYTEIPLENSVGKLNSTGRKIQNLYIIIQVIFISSPIIYKLIFDHTIYTVCESRYINHDTGLLDTLDSIGHYIQGFFAPISYYLMSLNSSKSKSWIFRLIILTYYCLYSIYPTYNLLKRFIIDYLKYDNFRDSSYYLNQWDYLFGLICGLIMVFIMQYFKVLIRDNTYHIKRSIALMILIFIWSSILFTLSPHITDNCQCPTYLRLPNCNITNEY